MNEYYFGELNDGSQKTKVPYTVLNIKRCRCTLCPVQADSECAQEKYSNSRMNWKAQEELNIWSLNRSLESIVRQVLLLVEI